MSEIEPPRPTGLATPRTATPASAPARVLEAAHGLRDAAPGTIVSATAVGRDSAGHLMLRTDRGLLVLATRADPPVGARVTLQLRPAGGQIQAYILSIRAPGDAPSGPVAGPRAAPAAAGAGPTAPAASGSAAPGPSGPAAAAAAGLPSRSWPALDAALLAVQRPGAAPEAADLAAALASAGNPLARATPRAGPSLAAGLVFLMAALRGGDLSRWLGGEPLRALARGGHDDLVRRLHGDFRRLAALSQDAGDDWRLFAVPVLGDDGIRPIRLILRRHPEREPEPGLPARFVVELDLPALGELQLDGLARTGRVDAILRSRTALPAAVRQRLARVFADRLRAAAWDGALTFHAGPDWHRLHLPAEAAGATQAGVTA